MQDPQTDEDWQEAVNGATFLLLIDAMRQFGLLDGGPTINVERCQEILALGAARGVFTDDPNLRPVEIGRWIHSTRLYLGISQIRLAKLSGIYQVRLSMIERGKATVRSDEIDRLREALTANDIEGSIV